MRTGLLSVKDLQGDAIVARDGPIGFIVDLYFDDARWTVRYLVVDTGRTMPQREVLVPSAALVPPRGHGSVGVALTRAEVERCADADTALPVWRQHELSYAARAASDPHLRSSDIVSGCNVEAQDGGVGHVADFMLDAKEWTIAGLLVDTANWLPGGKQVLLGPQAVERIDWPYHKLHARLTRKAIRELPSFER
jgi:sporulation protein YlmC with PRC-barrel domain